MVTAPEYITAMCPTELTVDGSSVVTASWIFNGPNNSKNGNESSSNAKTLVMAMELFRHGLYLEDTITNVKFSEAIITNVCQDDFQLLAELNTISTADSKDEFAKRNLM